MKKIIILSLIILSILGLSWIISKVEEIQVIKTFPTNTKQEEKQEQLVVEPVKNKGIIKKKYR